MTPRRLAVVEASFGTFEPFNVIVRAMFASKIEEAKAAPARVKKVRKLWQVVQVIRPMTPSRRANSHRDPPAPRVPPTAPALDLEVADEAI